MGKQQKLIKNSMVGNKQMDEQSSRKGDWIWATLIIVILLGISGAILYATLIFYEFSPIWGGTLYASFVIFMTYYMIKYPNVDEKLGGIFLIVFNIFVAAPMLLFFSLKNPNVLIQFATPPENFLDTFLFICDEFLKGATLDLMEGVRISIFDLTPALTKVEVLPLTPLSILSAIFRSLIGGYISYLFICWLKKQFSSIKKSQPFKGKNVTD